MKSCTHEGMIQLPARGSVADAWERLEAAVAARGLTVFARIDFAADAAEVGLQLRPTRLLVFGNPRAGTPLLNAAPTVGIDLPLKVLIWEAADGSASVGYNSPGWIGARHAVPEQLRARLQPVEALAAIAADLEMNDTSLAHVTAADVRPPESDRSNE